MSIDILVLTLFRVLTNSSSACHFCILASDCLDFDHSVFDYDSALPLIRYEITISQHLGPHSPGRKTKFVILAVTLIEGEHRPSGNLLAPFNL